MYGLIGNPVTPTNSQYYKIWFPQYSLPFMTKYKSLGLTHLNFFQANHIKFYKDDLTNYHRTPLTKGDWLLGGILL